MKTSKSDPRGEAGKCESPSITRRAALLGAVGTGALCLIGGVSSVSRSSEDVLIGVVKNRLPGLKMLSSDLHRFAGEFLRQDVYSQDFPAAMHGLRVTGSLVFSDLVRNVIPSKAARLLSKYEREILTSFMFSTDFFETYAKDGSAVSYVGFYNPYQRPCQDPLATTVEA